MRFPVRAWKESLAARARRSWRTFTFPSIRNFVPLFLQKGPRRKSKSPSRKSRRGIDKRRKSRQLQMENLEFRRLMTHNLYFDPTGALSTSGGGTGAWDTTTSNWYDPTAAGGAGADVPWTNGDDAVFPGSAGTVTVSAGISANSMTFSTTGYTVQDAGSGSPSLAVGTISVGTGLSDTIASVLSGSGALALSGPGTLNLSGANTYTGAMSISGGTLQLGNSSALGSSSGVSAISGATLDLDGQTIGSGVNLDNFAGTIVNSSSTAASFAGSINATTSANLTVGGSNNITLSGNIEGSGSLTDSDSGMLNLTGMNSYSGTTMISAGVLQLGSSGALSSSAVVGAGSGGTLDLDGRPLGVGISLDNFGGTLTNSSGSAAEVTGTINATTPASFTVTGTGNITLDSNITGPTSDTMTMSGSNTLTLTGSFSAMNLTVNSGTLDFGGSLAAFVNALSGSGGVITSDYGSTVIVGLGYANAGGTYSGDIQGNIQLELLGTGTETFAGTDDTYTGNTYIATGTLRLGSAAALSGSSTIDWGGSLDLFGTLEAFYGGTLDLNGQTVGAGVPFQIDVAAVDSTITNSSSTAASFAGNIPAMLGGPAATAPLTVNGTGDITLSGALQGKLSLTKTGSNTLTLSGTNTYFRSTTITTGTLQLDSSAALGSSSGVSAASGAILDLDGQTIGSGVNLNNFAGTIINSSSTAAGFAGTINATTAANFTVGGSNNITLSGNIEGSDSLTKSGSSTLILSGSNTYSGGTTISAGILQLGSSGALSSSAVVGAGSSGTLDLDGQALGSGISLDNFAGTLTNSNSTAASIAGTINATTSASFTVSGSNTITLSGALEGSGSLTDSDSGTLTLSGANTYGGSTTINSGSLVAGAADVIPSSSAVTLAGGAILVMNGYNQSIGSLTGTGDVADNSNTSVTLTIGSDNTSPAVFSGVLSDETTGSTTGRDFVGQSWHRRADARWIQFLWRQYDDWRRNARRRGRGCPSHAFGRFRQQRRVVRLGRLRSDDWLADRGGKRHKQQQQLGHFGCRQRRYKPLGFFRSPIRQNIRQHHRHPLG